MTYAFRLRDGVRFAPKDEKTIAVTDPLFNRNLDFAGAARTLIERADGTRPLPALLDEVAAAHPESARDAIERSFRTLLLLNLLEGAGAEIAARVGRLKRGEEKLPVVTLPEGRFRCQASGECCNNLLFGPLREEDIELVASIEPAKHFPAVAALEAERGKSASAAAGSFWYEAVSPDGVKMKFLRAIEGHCVFQNEAGLCGIHARFGYDKKPWVCRLFPYTRLPTIDGVKIYDDGQCASFHASAREGTPAAEEVPELLKILPPHFQLHHPIVFLDGGQPCDYGWFLEVQRAMMDLVAERRGGAIETLVALGRLARRYFRAITTCPLEAGEPDATARRAAAMDRAALFGPPADEEEAELARRGVEVVSVVADDLLRAIGSAMMTANPSIGGNPIRFLFDLAASLRVVQAVAAYRAGAHPRRLDPGFRAIAAVGADIPEFDELFRISIRQQLFGDRAVCGKKPAAGLLRLAFLALVTVQGARLGARLAGRDRVVAADFDYGHMRANRYFHNEAIEGIFAQRAECAWAVLEALPAALAREPAPAAAAPLAEAPAPA